MGSQFFLALGQDSSIEHENKTPRTTTKESRGLTEKSPTISVMNPVTEHNKSTISLMNSPCISTYDINASYQKV